MRGCSQKKWLCSAVTSRPCSSRADITGLTSSWRSTRTGTGATKTLTLADMKAILQNFPIIKVCSPQVDSRIQVVYGNQNWNTVYRGVSPDYLSIRRWSVIEGGAFSQEEVDASANVCLLGQ